MSSICVTWAESTVTSLRLNLVLLRVDAGTGGGGVGLPLLQSQTLGVPTGLPVPPALGVQYHALEELRHEGQSVFMDVGLAGEGVEHRVGGAADEGQRGGDDSTALGGFLKAACLQSRQKNPVIYLTSMLLISKSPRKA